MKQYWDKIIASVIAILTIVFLYFIITWNPNPIKEQTPERMPDTAIIQRMEALEQRVLLQEQRTSKIYDYIFNKPIPDET